MVGISYVAALTSYCPVRLPLLIAAGSDCPITRASNILGPHTTD